MNHRLFEELALGDGPLSQEQSAILKEHLEVCASCRSLAMAWEAVETQLRNTPALVPEPGFADRWQLRLEIELRRRERRQSLLVLGFSIGAAAIAFGSILILALPMLDSPKLLLWAWIYRLVGVMVYLEEMRDLIGYFAQSIRFSIPLSWWILVSGLLCELAVLWVVSLRLLTNTRKVVK